MSLRLGESMTAAEVSGTNQTIPGQAGAGAAAARYSSGISAQPWDDIFVSGATGAVSQIWTSHVANLARVAAAVQSGTYQVDARATSRALVEEALSLTV